jgi:hypothetical protein
MRKKPRDLVTISSYVPVLAACMSVTGGPVLEMGAGAYSTPLLHWLCNVQGKRLLTIEFDAGWLDFLSAYRDSWHELIACQRPQDHPRLADPWGLAFVDGRATERGPALARLHHVPLVVVHDSEPEHAGHYPQMAEELATFRYRRDVRIHPFEKNQTSVVSDQIVVVELLKELA